MDVQEVEETIDASASQDQTEGDSNKKQSRAKATTGEREPGKSLLRHATVSKILKADKELPRISQEGVFLISVATEEFIKRLAEAGHAQAAREKKSQVTYGHVAAAVRRSEEFMFLEEIIPTSMPSAPAKRAKATSKGPTDGSTKRDFFGKGKDATEPDSNAPIPEEDTMDTS